jgi:hypothetical protein
MPENDYQTLTVYHNDDFAVLMYLIVAILRGLL